MLERIGRYRIRNRIAAGGFASVYLADDAVLDSPVAIKVLADNLAADPDLRIRFLREARMLRRVRSERLVTVYDIGELEHGQPYLVMEYLGLGTLADRVAWLRGNGWQPNQADLAVAIDELADCLAALHSAGVVHRDVKPSNLMLRQRDSVADGQMDRLIRAGETMVLADLGLAKILEPGSGNLTIGGGTRGFMAPEQHRPNYVVDGRADLFAASAVLLTLLTGRTPPDIVAAPDSLDDDLAGIDGALGRALRRGLNREPRERFASVDEWRSAMLRAIGPLTPGDAAAAQPQPAKRRHWVMVATLLGVVTVLGGLQGYGLLPGGDALPGAGVLSGGDPQVRVIGPDRLAVGDAGAWIAVTDGSPHTYTWTSPDGVVRTGPQLVVTPTRPGTFEIDLAVIDVDGNRIDLSVPLTVYPADPLLHITGPALVTVGQTATLRADAPEGAAVTWIDWNGETHAGATLMLRAHTPGRLTVELRATVDGKAHTVRRTITVVAR